MCLQDQSPAIGSYDQDTFCMSSVPFSLKLHCCWWSHSYCGILGRGPKLIRDLGKAMPDLRRVYYCWISSSIWPVQLQIVAHGLYVPEIMQNMVDIELLHMGKGILQRKQLEEQGQRSALAHDLHHGAVDALRRSPRSTTTAEKALRKSLQTPNLYLPQLPPRAFVSSLHRTGCHIGWLQPS